MDFIFTPILWLLPLASIPIILHLINNRKFTYRALLPDYFKKLLKTKRLVFPNFL